MLLFGCKPEDKEPLTATRNDYLGVWQCDEYNQNQQLIASFQVQITAHPSVADKVLIDNFNLLGNGAQTEATAINTKLTIPQQIVAGVTGVSVVGSGYITNKLQTIELSYTVDDGSGQPENINATYTKL